MFICVDFDGTIVDHVYPEIGEPAPEAIIWMKQWQMCGANIILWTMRDGKELQEAVDYLRNNGIELYGANKNKSQSHWTKSPKAYAHIYVDDAAFGCPLIQPEGFNRPCVDWKTVGPAINRILLRE